MSRFRLVSLAGFVVLPLVALLAFATFASAGTTAPPQVAKTVPANGATDVDPSLRSLSVTFDQPMRDRSWSWVYENKSTFPMMTGDPGFDAAKVTCSLPVKLLPGKRYIIWINSQKFKGFINDAGIPAKPFRWVFTTAQ